MKAEIEMVVIECADCGMPFGIPADRQERLRKCHNSFWCPAGHVNVYNSQTQEEKLREELRKRTLDLELAESKLAKKSRKKK